jgi:hypothetical protein
MPSDLTSATFADALARLRQHVWFERFATSAGAADMKESLPPDLQRLIQLAYPEPTLICPTTSDTPLNERSALTFS